MVMTEEGRRALFSRLVEVLGEAEAVVLIDQLPSPGHEVATKQHVDERFAEFEQLLRAEVGQLRSECRTDMAELRTEMAELRAEVNDRLARHTRVTVGATVAMNAATMGVVLTALGAAL